MLRDCRRGTGSHTWETVLLPQASTRNNQRWSSSKEAQKRQDSFNGAIREGLTGKSAFKTHLQKQADFGLVSRGGGTWPAKAQKRDLGKKIYREHCDIQAGQSTTQQKDAGGWRHDKWGRCYCC